MPLSEQSIIDFLKRTAAVGPAVEVGIGHDAAVVRSPAGEGLVLKSDQTIEEVHFVRREQPLELVGRKALARVLSDLGAIGARPIACLCSLALPDDVTESDVHALLGGLLELAKRDSVSLVGGDLSRSPKGIVVDVSALGFLEGRAPMLRSGAKAGDLLVVTGPLGGSREGWHLSFEPRWRLGMALAASGAVHAALDVSDGLARDVHHLCRESQVGARIELGSLPLRELAGGRRATIEQALQDGEDFELLLAVAPDRLAGLSKFDRHRKELRLPEETSLSLLALTAIGQVTAASAGVVAVDAKGNVTALPPGGYQHQLGA